MPDNTRPYPYLSACGLNCGLCPRHYTDGPSRCPGCGGEGFTSVRPTCGIISCCKRHNVEYCFQCGEYRCERYQNSDLDSFITHRHMQKDFAKAAEIGLEAYQAELEDKMAVLSLLLDKFNDGRKKSFYCLAVNLLELPDVYAVMQRIQGEVDTALPPKERAGQAVRCFQDMADERGVELKLRKK